METAPKNPSLCGLLPDELCEAAGISPAFRGRQLFEGIHRRGVLDFNRMTSLPGQMREDLFNLFGTPLSSRVDQVREDTDGTVKISLRLHDGLLIESVLLNDEKGRKTACLSSQVGCALACSFCRTGQMGLLRDLSAGEIVEQYLHLRQLYGEIGNIVFMGMGEPLMNLKEVLRAVRVFHRPDGINLGMRRITISTSGVAAGIHELRDAGLPVRLAVSLITADQELREKLMPIARSVPLKELQQALIRFQEFYKKRISLEYVVFHGLNTRDRDVELLEDFARPLQVMVNLIPWNPVDELAYEEPSEREIQRFAQKLTDRHIPVTRRYRRGRGINGACGQLATENRKVSGNPPE
jgi:23S rRNA (adenine2503-C2)-methyltransferase